MWIPDEGCIEFMLAFLCCRWTEGVRKEWLSRVPGVSEEGAADPLRSTEPLDDGPLTGTHSREEVRVSQLITASAIAFICFRFVSSIFFYNSFDYFLNCFHLHV